MSTIPSYISAGTYAHSTSTQAVSYPASGIVAGDFLLLLVESANQPITGPAGWTSAGTAPGTGTAAAAAATCLQAFWKAASGSENGGSVSINDAGDHTSAQIFVFRGVDTSSPIHQYSTDTVSSASSSISFPSVTTTQPNCLIVNALSIDRDLSSTTNFSSVANASLSSVTERSDNTTSDGGGGGIGVFTGGLATAGATGNTTATIATTATQARMTIALKPLTAFSLTAGAASYTEIGQSVDFGYVHSGVNILSYGYFDNFDASCSETSVGVSGTFHIDFGSFGPTAADRIILFYQLGVKDVDDSHANWGTPKINGVSMNAIDSDFIDLTSVVVPAAWASKLWWLGVPTNAVSVIDIDYVANSDSSGFGIATAGIFVSISGANTTTPVRQNKKVIGSSDPLTDATMDANPGDQIFGFIMGSVVSPGPVVCTGISGLVDAGWYTSSGGSSNAFGFGNVYEPTGVTDLSISMTSGLNGAFDDHIMMLVTIAAASEDDVVLTVDTASYSESGQTVGLKYGRAVAVAKATYLESAQDILFKRSYILSAGAASFIEAAQNITLHFVRALQAAAASYSLSAQNVLLKSSKRLAVGAASFVESAQNVSLKASRVILAAATSFTFVGRAVQLVAQNTAAAANFTIDEQDVSLKWSHKLILATTSYVYTAQEAILARGRFITAGLASFVETAQNVGLHFGRRVGASASAFTYSAKDVLLKRSYTPLVASAASFASTAKDVVLSRTRSLLGSAAEFIVTSTGVTLNLFKYSAKADFSLAAQDVNLTTKPPADGAIYVYSAKDIELITKSVSANRAIFSFTAQSVSYQFVRKIDIEPAVFELTVFDSVLFYGSALLWMGDQPSSNSWEQNLPDVNTWTSDPEVSFGWSNIDEPL